MKLNLERRPESLRQSLVGAEDHCRNSRLAVGLDLGTTTGVTYTYLPPGGSVDPATLRYVFGQWDLSAGSYESGAIRFVRLRHFLEALRPALVAYEDVKFDMPVSQGLSAGALMARVATASELLGAYKATVVAWCEERDIPCVGFKIATIKKRATNRGNAGKVDIIQACNTLFGTEFSTDGYENSGVDNIADSAFVCRLALEQYADGLLPSQSEITSGELP